MALHGHGGKGNYMLERARGSERGTGGLKQPSSMKRIQSSTQTGQPPFVKGKKK